MAYQNIPPELREGKRWLCWKRVHRDGKWTKVPITPTGSPASVRDPATWSPFEEAVAGLARPSVGAAGIGRVFVKADGFVGIDLDWSDDPLQQAAHRKILESFKSYAELSPSGKGVHIITRGSLPGPGRRRHGVEAYDDARFFTFTGDQLSGRDTIIDEQQLIDQLYAELGGENGAWDFPSEDSKQNQSDADIHARLRAGVNCDLFTQLFEGAWRDPRGVSNNQRYPSASEADIALCNLIGQQTGNAEQLIRIFLSSGMAHGREEKLRRPDYQQRLIRRAFDRKLPTALLEAVERSVSPLLAKFNAEQASHAREPPQHVNGHDFAADKMSVTLDDFDPADLGDEPPPRLWCVPDLIEHENVALLYGEGGQGKSRLALQLAVCRAIGQPWAGKMPTQGRTLILSAEDDRKEMHRRLDDLRRYYDFAWADYRGLIKAIDLVGKDSILAAPTRGLLEPTLLYKAVDAYAGQFRPSLIICDVLAALYGGSEIDRPQVRSFVNMLRRLALVHECSVLLLGHPSRAGVSTGTGTSGSTDWNNAVRNRLYFRTPTGEDGEELDTDVRVLESMKANNAKAGEQIFMRWDSGVYVADNCSEDIVRLGLEKAYEKVEELLVKLIRDYAARGKYFSAKNGPNYAPVKLAGDNEAVRAKVTKEMFEVALMKLIKNGVIKITKAGRKSDTTELLEINNDAEFTLRTVENGQ